MLVLSRKKNESIMVGEDVEITILKICGSKVCLGITAPGSISVHRKEVFEAIQAESIELVEIFKSRQPNLPVPAIPIS